MGENQPGMFGRMLEAGQKLKVKSALNPMLWLWGIVGTPCFFIIAFKDSPPLCVVYILCAIIGVALFGFLFLLFFDRDKLQSEEFQIRKKELEYAQEKGEDRPKVVLEGKIETHTLSEVVNKKEIGEVLTDADIEEVEYIAEKEDKE